MSDLPEKSAQPVNASTDGDAQSMPQAPAQEVVHVRPVKEEEGDDSLLLSGRALAVAFIGLLSAVFLVS